MKHARPSSAKRISVRSVLEIQKILWPSFIELDGCTYAEFQSGEGPITLLRDGMTETESFVNHTHIFDEFRNRAASTQLIEKYECLDVIEEQYDTTSPDFIAACKLGYEMARMWAIKLKADFPQKRFRVYYTQYDNPIVRFHTVREDEPVWISDEQLTLTDNPTFAESVIYDTDYLASPVIKRTLRPN